MRCQVFKSHFSTLQGITIILWMHSTNSPYYSYTAFIAQTRTSVTLSKFKWYELLANIIERCYNFYIVFRFLLNRSNDVH